MTLLKWIMLSAIILVADMLALIITPIVVPFSDKKTGKLPAFFWWMDNPTAPIPGPASITGDILNRYGWYCASVYWLWRNSVYALADSMRVDFDFNDPGSPVYFWYAGNQAVNNDPYCAGWFVGTLRQRDTWAFEIRACWPWPIADKCASIRAGWKLSKWFDGYQPEKPTATGMLQAPSIRPLLTRK